MLPENDALTEFVFGGDDSYVRLLVGDGVTEDALHSDICDVYMKGCFHHNGLCSKETHTVVSRRMEKRLGVRPVVLQDASICLPFVAESCTRFAKVLCGALGRSSLVIERHGTPDTLFVVRFEVCRPRSDVFLDNMCARPGG